MHFKGTGTVSHFDFGSPSLPVAHMLSLSMLHCEVQRVLAALLPGATTLGGKKQMSIVKRQKQGEHKEKGLLHVGRWHPG